MAMTTKKLEAKYKQLLTMASKARKHCFNRDGNLVAFLKGGHGGPVPNPYLAEYHRCIAQAAQLARDLGLTEPVDEVARVEMARATERGDRADELRALAGVLAQAIDECKGHGMAALAREYRETIRELGEIEEPDTENDPIARMVDAHREARADILKLA